MPSPDREARLLLADMQHIHGGLRRCACSARDHWRECSYGKPALEEGLALLAGLDDCLFRLDCILRRCRLTETVPSPVPSEPSHA